MWESSRRRTPSKSRMIGFYWLFHLFLLVIDYSYWFQLGLPVGTINMVSNDAKHLGNCGSFCLLATGPMVLQSSVKDVTSLPTSPDGCEDGMLHGLVMKALESC